MEINEHITLVAFHTSFKHTENRSNLNFLQACVFNLVRRPHEGLPDLHAVKLPIYLVYWLLP